MTFSNIYNDSYSIGKPQLPFRDEEYVVDPVETIVGWLEKFASPNPKIGADAVFYFEVPEMVCDILFLEEV